MIFTDLNIEQSIAKYLAGLFTTKGFRIYWWDTKVLEAGGDNAQIMTVVREYPKDQALIVSQSVPQTDNVVRTPAVCVTVEHSPYTSNKDLMGIGEQAFDWSAEL